MAEGGGSWWVGGLAAVPGRKTNREDASWGRRHSRQGSSQRNGMNLYSRTRSEGVCGGWGRSEGRVRLQKFVNAYGMFWAALVRG